MNINELESLIIQAENSFFSLQNLPYGVFKPKTSDISRIGCAFGNKILDLSILEATGVFPFNTPNTLFDRNSLNLFAAQGKAIELSVRTTIQDILYSWKKNSDLLQRAFFNHHDIIMKMPFHTEGYSDFYASEHHATNVGVLFRGHENPLMPNWKYLPVGYHGRTSTLFLSKTKIRRPSGQIILPNQDAPILSLCKKLDFELELGIFVGKGNPDGQPIAVNEASAHLFGVVLLNDWSARDIQAFEYQPLGPFLSKSFATSISPWVVSFSALEPFMSALPKQNPTPVSYLQQNERFLPNIRLKVEIKPRGSELKSTLCETTATELYWTFEQMLAHHTINHCIMLPGDLLGSGTISGPERKNWGSLLEITENGKQPIKLTDGSERTFLQDSDTVIMTAYCESSSGKIGFGSVEGTILP